MTRGFEKVNWDKVFPLVSVTAALIITGVRERTDNCEVNFSVSFKVNSLLFSEDQGTAGIVKMETSMQLSSGNVTETRETHGNLLLRKMKRLTPVNFCQEAIHISRLAGPVVINVSGRSIGVGLSSACDTLISQTHGSKNLKRIGVILQRGILILMIACFPCWAIFINIEHILLAFKLSPAVAKLTQLYVKIFIPGLPAVFLHNLEIRYLQNQGIIMPQMFTSFIANIVNAVINYLLLHVLTLGVSGSAAANVVSQYCQVILLFVYIRWKRLYVKTWTGWSIDCLQEWDHFSRLAIPSMIMICFEHWAYQIGTFLIGLINEVQLGAQAIIDQTLTVAYLIASGYGIAVTVHVGNALGARNPEQAANSAKVAIYCIVCIALVNAVIIGATRNVVAYIFTNDKEIVHLVTDVMPLCAAFHLFDAMAGVCSGVIRGTGKQKLGAIGNLVGYYLFGLPIGIALMFAAKLGVFGLVSGMFISVFLQSVFFLTVIYRINWNKTSNQAQVNAGVMNDLDTSNSTSGGQIQNISPEENTENTAVVLMPNVCQVEQKIDKDRVTEVPSMLDAGVTTVGEILSTKQLIIRRGLAFLSGPLVLAIGLVIHLILAKDM
ncbi:multidrug and toxin extrusion protein 1-like isoform X2 [Heterodontus francisci]|uniref:multidrug and toxin extrusion protein 1-like isoform X2 n=1 Tax=Heterodontus francisci TaxID=7792 RepID=UPI00355AD0CB